MENTIQSLTLRAKLREKELEDLRAGSEVIEKKVEQVLREIEGQKKASIVQEKIELMRTSIEVLKLPTVDGVHTKRRVMPFPQAAIRSGISVGISVIALATFFFHPSFKVRARLFLRSSKSVGEVFFGSGSTWRQQISLAQCTLLSTSQVKIGSGMSKGMQNDKIVAVASLLQIRRAYLRSIKIPSRL